MKKILSCFILGILAGLSIALGSFVFLACLACDQKILGSILFSVGLLMCCAFSLNLFTGKVGFIFENKPHYLLDLLIMYLGNILGAAGSGLLVYAAISHLPNTSIFDQAVAVSVSRSITVNNWWVSLIMAFFCGILVFLAVYGWKKFDNYALKITCLILCVTTFVATGTEHCIANMFYFSAGFTWNVSTILNIVIVTIGNALGSLTTWVLFYGSQKLLSPTKKDN